jgi:hypothetical protein
MRDQIQFHYEDETPARSTFGNVSEGIIQSVQWRSPSNLYPQPRKLRSRASSRFAASPLDLADAGISGTSRGGQPSTPMRASRRKRIAPPRRFHADEDPDWKSPSSMERLASVGAAAVLGWMIGSVTNCSWEFVRRTEHTAQRGRQRRRLGARHPTAFRAHAMAKFRCAAQLRRVRVRISTCRDSAGRCGASLKRTASAIVRAVQEQPELFCEWHSGT